jgi:DNA repair protein RadD
MELNPMNIATGKFAIKNSLHRTGPHKMAAFELREYQRAGVESLRASYRAGRRAPLFVLPTGGGKTAVFSHIAEGARARGKKVTILVHRKELLLQASAALTRLSVEHGILAPWAAQSPADVQIASIQTLARRIERVSKPDLLIIDEAHHATSASYRAVLAAYPAAHVLGVTATPCRTDGAGLRDIFDDLILGPSIGELIRQGFLVPPVVYAPPIGIDVTGVRRKMGDYDKGELAERIDKPKITGSAVEHYQKYCPGQPAIAFCVSIQHAENVAEEFRGAGVRAVRVDGGMDDSSRRAAIEGLGNGAIDLVTSADLIGEGVDIPRVSAAILLRPTHSTALYLQQVGRALRPYEGKTQALILDHVGNVMRHGLPDDDRDWTLDAAPKSGREKADPTLIRVEQCERCFFVYESGPEKCPACGNLQPSKVRKIDAVDGELAKLTKEAVEAARKAKRREQGSAQTLEDLIALGRAKGYKNPKFWAEKVFAGRRRR